MNIYKLTNVETQCLASLLFDQKLINRDAKHCVSTFDQKLIDRDAKHCVSTFDQKLIDRDAKHCVSTSGLVIQIRI
ncbi:MAG: hypothetical protein LBB88_08040 [Planctomycetaceae bacterium]|nr:hypothetical protein [Planctomycetaceae bacterium]